MKSWIALCFAAALSLSNFEAFAAAAHGDFRVVKGSVQVKSPDGKTARARIGSKVLPGDVIISGKDSRAKIVMVDNNEINISPDSEIKIEKYEFDPNQGKKDVLLNVIYGKVRSKVEQKYDGKTSKFEVKTPAAVAGVRGTNFLTSHNPTTGLSQVVTFEGQVQFGAMAPGAPGRDPQMVGAVMVNPGQMASIGAGQMAPTAPVNMSPQDLKSEDVGSSAQAPAPRSENSMVSSSDTLDSGPKQDERGPSSAAGAGGSGNTGGTTASNDRPAGPPPPPPPPPAPPLPAPVIIKPPEVPLQETVKGNGNLKIIVNQ